MTDPRAQVFDAKEPEQYSINIGPMLLRTILRELGKLPYSEIAEGYKYIEDQQKIALENLNTDFFLARIQVKQQELEQSIGRYNFLVTPPPMASPQPAAEIPQPPMPPFPSPSTQEITDVDPIDTTSPTADAVPVTEDQEETQRGLHSDVVEGPETDLPNA